MRTDCHPRPHTSEARVRNRATRAVIALLRRTPTATTSSSTRQDSAAPTPAAISALLHFVHSSVDVRRCDSSHEAQRREA